MHKKSVNKTNNEQLNWFWTITSRWWFFPLFSYMMSFLYLVILDRDQLFYYGVSWALWYTFGMFFSIPQGLAYFVVAGIQIITRGNMFFVAGFIGLLTYAIYYVYFAVSIFRIVKAKNKENKILKKQIKILFLLVLLSFAGFILSGYYHINANFAP